MPEDGQTMTRKVLPRIALSVGPFQSWKAVQIPVGRLFYEHPEFGGLEVTKKLERRVHPEDEDRYDRDRVSLLQTIDFKLPGDHKLRLSEQPFNISEPCQVLSWTENIHPTCNLQHEISPSIETSDYISSGSFRDSWLLTSPSEVVMKTFVFEEGRPFGPLIMRFIEVSDCFCNIMIKSRKLTQNRPFQRDVVVMEATSASPRIVNIFSYCGTTILDEALDLFVPEISPTYYNDADHAQETKVKGAFPPASNLTASRKLDLAIHAAQSLADLHGCPKGVIVHGDYHPEQYLKTKDGRLVLSDFNHGNFLEYNEESKEYCPFHPVGAWDLSLSPEQYKLNATNESSDIFAFGNLLYTVITGRTVWYDTEFRAARRKIRKGILPVLDDRYRQQSPIESQLVEIMERCWKYQPQDRPSIFDVVHFLIQLKKGNPSG